ncbi:Predicted N-acyltransferase, GNAT family [Marinobacter daqiaonensis]|uniref:Predicted N-acyltransferase, GNAT family n=1 Tax=Marinobacter daqiaonensis TaxID=650891 RepID=A0A1I6H2C1_9GAMM|nr:GNAT family N-acetyltransferase [Marinobacter daqiaonensis]SFR48552.1 Predicted N-acyltransferase, GNAT family [Marinobacter daqiaonensis]
MTLRFRKYSWQLAPKVIKDIRQAVFIDEQRVPPELEWDDTDEIADHFVAVTSDNTPVATARLFRTLDETGHIGRMAVLPEHRGQGIGEAMLRHLMAEAEGEVEDLHLSAQEHAVPFYQRSGFHVCSGPYDDAGIPHFAMRCLAPELVNNSFSAERPRRRPMILGADDQSWLIDRDHQVSPLMDSLIGQARQRLWLYDRLLDHEIYDRERFRDLLSALARHHRNSEVRLLIHDDGPLVKRRHQVVELLRRLPSSITLRLVNDDYPAEGHPFLLVDREGVLVRHRFDRPDGFAGFADSGRVKLLADTFQRMWDTARPSLELRELPL